MVTEVRHKKFELLTDDEKKTVFLHLNLFKKEDWTETEKKVDKYYKESLGATKKVL